MVSVQITYCIGDTSFWYLISWQHLPHNFCSLAITNNTTSALADGSVVYTSSYKQVICFLNGMYLPEIFNCPNSPLPCSWSHHRVPIRLLSSPERPWWHSLLSAGLCSCDEELSWSWLERAAVSLEEFSIRNVFISYFCELMQKWGWLGQCLADEKEDKEHEVLHLPFYIHLWNKWDSGYSGQNLCLGRGRQDKGSQKAVALLHLCYNICFLPSAVEQSLSGQHYSLWKGHGTPLSLGHSASGILRAVCAYRVESTGSTTHFCESLIQKPSKTDCAFPVPPLALSPPYFSDKRVDLEKTHLC